VLRGIGAAFDLFLDGANSAVTPLLLEAGGHRYQRVPPTERNGRVQTSTVTVAVFKVMSEGAYLLEDQDIRIITTKDGGPGGQHRNKTESCVIMRHLPTGIEAKASAKCQHQNRRAARTMLEARVATFFEDVSVAQLRHSRKEQVGSGQRGDKIRTYRESVRYRL